VCRSKHVEQLRNIGIINSTTRSHLVGYFYTIWLETNPSGSSDIVKSPSSFTNLVTSRSLSPYSPDTNTRINLRKDQRDVQMAPHIQKQ